MSIVSENAKPAEFRLSDQESEYVAAALHQAAFEGRLTMVYCRQVGTGELLPVLAVVMPSEEGTSLQAIAQIFPPGRPSGFLPPTEEDNAQPEARPEIIVPGGYR